MMPSLSAEGCPEPKGLVDRLNSYSPKILTVSAPDYPKKLTASVQNDGKHCCVKLILEEKLENKLQIEDIERGAELSFSGPLRGPLTLHHRQILFSNDQILVSDRQTDGRTDGRTDAINLKTKFGITYGKWVNS